MVERRPRRLAHVDTRHREIVVAVEQLCVAERGGFRQTVNRLQNRIDLHLIGGNLIVGEPCLVGRLVDQILQPQQQSADLL